MLLKKAFVKKAVVKKCYIDTIGLIFKLRVHIRSLLEFLLGNP